VERENNKNPKLKNKKIKNKKPKTKQKEGLRGDKRKKCTPLLMTSLAEIRSQFEATKGSKFMCLASLSKNALLSLEFVHVSKKGKSLINYI
jgi:hypothetical protein